MASCHFACMDLAHPAVQTTTSWRFANDLQTSTNPGTVINMKIELSGIAGYYRLCDGRHSKKFLISPEAGPSHTLRICHLTSPIIRRMFFGTAVINPNTTHRRFDSLVRLELLSEGSFFRGGIRRFR
ncbi:hypothetical protein FRC03_000621 [Tulasnella sp. 419]|nr:hypothetical protein FRC03_000621 [Tulasnella sp. 419]